MPGIMEDMGTIEFTDACNPHKAASCSLPDTLSAVLPLIPSDVLGKATAFGVDPSTIIANPAPLCGYFRGCRGGQVPPHNVTVKTTR